MIRSKNPTPARTAGRAARGETAGKRGVSPLERAFRAYRAEWAALRPAFDEAIERCRKSDAVLEIRDAAGRSVPGAEVTVRQRRHAFAFGCNALMLSQFGDAEDNARYEEAFAKLFNLATTTFCWSEIEPAPGELRFAEGSREIFRRPPPDRVVAFAKKHGIALKGQPLLADTWFPKWAPRDPETVRRLYGDYFAKVAARYGREFAIWDVVNEAFLCAGRTPDFPLYTPSLDYVAWAFREALRVFPAAARLEINEATEAHTAFRDKYFDLVKRLVDSGAGPRSVGFQFHMFSPETLAGHLRGEALSLPELRETYGRFAAFGLPLYVSEITIPSTLGGVRIGEEIQAEVLANLYRFWFGVPQMAGIIHWNLADGPAWKNEGDLKGGLLDGNLCEKPAYQALYQLLNREWKTRLGATSDAGGRVRFRGFHGTYAVTVKAGGNAREFEFDLAAGAPNAVRLTL